MGGIPDVVTRFIADVLPFVRNVKQATNSVEGLDREQAKAAATARQMGRSTADAGNRAARAHRQAARAADSYADQLRDVAVAARLAGGGLSRMSRAGLSLVKIAAMVGVLSALAGGAAAATGPVLGLVGALAPIGGLAAALPAVLLSAAVAMNVLKLAVSGMGDAFSAAMAGDTKKFEESLKNLSPAARTVARDFKSIVPELKSVRRAAQDAFAGPLRGELQATARVLTGPLRSGVALVAREFGSAARDALRFAQSTRAVGAVRTIFGSVAEVINRLRPALQPIIAGFTDLAVAGSAALAKMASGAARVGIEFGKWMSSLADSGRVEEIIRTAVGVLRQLGTIAANVGSILSSVFSAANTSGGGLLGTLGRLTGQAAAWLKTSEGAAVLRNIFNGLAAIGSALAPVFQALVRAAGTLAPAIGRIATAVGPVLTTALNAVAPALAALEPGITAIVRALGGAIQALAPALIPLAQAISSIMIAVAPLLPVLGQLLAGAIMALIPVVTALVPPLVEVAKIVGVALLQAIQTLAPVLLPLGMAFAQIVAAVAPLLPMLAQVLVAALLALLPVVVALVPPIVQVAQTMGTELLRAILAIAPHLPALAVAVGQLLIALIPLIPPIMRLVIELTPLIPIVTQAIGLLAQLATAVMPLLVLAIKNLIIQATGIVIEFRFIWAIISRVVAVAIDAIKRTVGKLAELPDKFREWFGGAARAVGDRLSAVVSAARGLPGKIKSALGNLGSLLYNAGRNVVQGLINGIYSMFRALGRAASSVARTIRNYLPFSPAKTGPLSGRGNPRYSGISIARQLASGIISARGAVSSAMTVLASQVAAPQFGGGLALAGTVGGRGGTTIIQHNTTIPIAGSVMSERDLLDVVTEHVLGRAGRNPSNGLNPRF